MNGSRARGTQCSRVTDLAFPALSTVSSPDCSSACPRCIIRPCAPPSRFRSSSLRSRPLHSPPVRAPATSASRPASSAPGPLNAITDVAGVKVGQTTVIVGRLGAHRRHRHPAARRQPVPRSRAGRRVRRQRVRQAASASTQVAELGELETPILLTCTLCVWRAADAMVGRDARAAGHGARALDQSRRRRDERRRAERDPLAARSRAATCAPRSTGASSGPVAEGSVGAGAGTVAFGWKGGIGTSSRVLPEVARRLDGRRARADQLRRRAAGARRAGGKGARALRVQGAVERAARRRLDA